MHKLTVWSRVGISMVHVAVASIIEMVPLHHGVLWSAERGK